MLLEVSKLSEVGAPPPAAWEFIRDVTRLTACIPNVSDVETLDDTDRRYSAVVADKLGPFSLRVPVQIQVQSVEDESRHITAELTGNDSRGQARVKGTLEATCAAMNPGTRIELSMRMEVLGKLATLGAGPMRRRADEVFAKFAQCVESQLGAPCR